MALRKRIQLAKEERKDEKQFHKKYIFQNVMWSHAMLLTKRKEEEVFALSSWQFGS